MPSSSSADDGLSLDERKRRVALAPEDVEARVGLALALLRDGQALAAEAQVEAALARDPDHRGARLAEVRVFAREARWAKAEQAVLALVDRRPEDGEVLDAAGEVFFEMGRLLEAALAWELAVEHGLGTAERTSILGRILGQLGFRERARRHLVRAIALDPGHAETQAALRAVTLELGEEDTTVIARGADVLVSRMREAWARREVVPALAPLLDAVRAGDVGAAKRKLALADAAARASGDFDVLRGEALLADGKRDAAKAAFRAALDRGTADRLPRNRAAEIALYEGDAKEAQRLARGGAQADEDAESLEIVGDAARTLGELDAADAAYLAAKKHGAPGAHTKLDELRARRSTHGAGRVLVLGWNPFGGAGSPVEAVAIPGKGELVVTGNVTRLGKEAGTVAHGFLRARATALGLGTKPTTHDLHLHYEDAATQKTGLSSGLALALAGWSAYTGVALPKGLATTGSLTLLGAVQPIDGLREKLSAAVLAECPLVLYPRRNRPQMEAVPRFVRDRQAVRAVETFDEALSVLGLARSG